MAATTQNTTPTEGGLLAGQFKTPEELEAAYAALNEKLANIEAAHSADMATAIDAAIRKFEAEARKDLGTPNTNPGLDREPTKTKLPDGTVRVDY